MLPPHERRILEAHVRGVPLSLLALQEQPLNEYEQQDLSNLIRMRLQGYPLQYLTGSQDFYGRTFYVNTHVLVPRPETEGLVERVLKDLGSEKEKLLGLDLGTGSGCIAISLGVERPAWRIHASDFSADALEVALENMRRHRVTNVDLLRVQNPPLIEDYEVLADLDFIVSNPPYLLESEDIAEDVRQNEPGVALFAPTESPLLYYKFIAELANQRLKADGLVALEIAENRAQETAAVFQALGYSTRIEADLAGRPRYLLARRER